MSLKDLKKSYLRLPTESPIVLGKENLKQEATLAAYRADGILFYQRNEPS